MGFLYCSEMGEAFIKHLKNKGPLSIMRGVKLYWKKQPKGYSTTDEDIRHQAQMAMEQSVLYLFKTGYIQPCDKDREKFFEFIWYEEAFRIGKEGEDYWGKNGKAEFITTLKSLDLNDLYAFVVDAIRIFFNYDFEFDDKLLKTFGFFNIRFVLTEKYHNEENPNSIILGGVDL